MGGGKVDRNGGVLPYGTDRNATALGDLAPRKIAKWLGLRLPGKTQTALPQALREEILKSFSAEDPNYVSRIMAGILKRAKKDSEGMPRIYGVEIPSFSDPLDAAAPESPFDRVRNRTLEAIRTTDGVYCFTPQIRTARDLDAVITVLKNPSERMEAMIEAASMELVWMETETDFEVYDDFRRLEASVKAMKEGLLMAFPDLAEAELEAKVDVLVPEAQTLRKQQNGKHITSRDQLEARKWYLKGKDVEAFKNLLMRDWLRKAVVPGARSPDRQAPGHQVRVRGARGKVWRDMGPKGPARRPPDGLPTRREVVEEKGGISRHEISNPVKREIPRTLLDWKDLTVGHRDDTRLDKLVEIEGAFQSVLLAELKRVYPNVEEWDLQDRAKVTIRQAVPPDGKALENPTVGDLPHVITAFEMRHKPPGTPAPRLPDPPPSPGL